MFTDVKADNIYIMNAPGYNTAQPDLIIAMESLGHTVTVNSTDFSTLPPAFTSACLDPGNGYHWLCFFGDFDFSFLSPGVSNFIADGGKVYYNYEVSCCTTSSSGAAAMVSAVTGLPVTPSAVEYVGLTGGGGAGWQSEIPGCFTITGNAFKPLDGLPLANQLVATLVPPGSSPDLSSGSNFGFFFTGNDIPGNTLNGSLTGMGDINMWYDGAEPNAAPINLDLVAYFFPNGSTICHLATAGCATQCPFENVLGPNASICENADLTLDATSASAAGYLWYDNSTNPTKLINQPGIYWVEVTDGTETCRDSIEVTELIVVVDAGQDEITCPGFSVALLASGADTYFWQPAATLNFSDIPNPQASPIATTTYTVTGTVDGCTDTDQVIISIDPIDVTYNVVLTPQVCVTNGSLMIENVSGSSANYILEINNAVVNADEVYSLIAGLYQLQITDDNGCQANEDITLPLNNGNISWTSSLLNPRCTRPGSIVLDNIQGGTEPYEYKLNNNLQPDPNFENLSFGDFTVKITDQNGCSTTMNYTLEDLPNGIVSTVHTIDGICETPGRLTHVDIVNALSPVYLELDNLQYFNNDIAIDTTEHVLLVRDADGCEFTNTFQIANHNPTQAIFTADPYLAKAPVDVTFTNASLNASSYLWDFGNGKFSENVNDEMRYLEPGDYNVVLTAFDDVNGCSDTMLFIIYVRPPNSIYVPNTFTPDNDGINDVFMIKGENIALENFSFTVFNRWGDAVWTSVDPTEVWTGSFQGGNYFIPDGVYPFVLKYQYTDTSDRQTMSGHVQIIR